jgi:hypothetical protein
VTNFPLAELQQGTSDGKLGDFAVVKNSLRLSSEGISFLYIEVLNH